MTLNHSHLAFDQLLKTHSLGFLTEMQLKCVSYLLKNLMKLADFSSINRVM